MNFTQSLQENLETKYLNMQNGQTAKLIDCPEINSYQTFKTKSEAYHQRIEQEYTSFNNAIIEIRSKRERRISAENRERERQEQQRARERELQERQRVHKKFVRTKILTTVALLIPMLVAISVGIGIFSNKALYDAKMSYGIAITAWVFILLASVISLVTAFVRLLTIKEISYNQTTYKNSSYTNYSSSKLRKKQTVINNRPATIVIDVVLAVITLTMFIVSIFPSKVYRVMHWSIFLVFAIVILLVFLFVIIKKKSLKEINAPWLSLGLLIFGVFGTLWVIILPNITGIEISDAVGLNAFGNYRTATFVIADDIDCTETSIKQIKEFHGSINGNGHTISNLTVNGYWIQWNYGNEITNINFDNLTVYGSGLIFHNSANISKVKINNAKLINNRDYSCGLLCSENGGIISKVKIKNLELNNNADATWIGGIAGRNVYDKKPIIEECGIDHLTIINNYDTRKSFCGGIVGQTYNSIKNCYVNNASITIPNKTFSYAGGLVGECGSILNRTEISNCYVVFNNISNTEYIMRFVGVVDEKVNLLIKNSYAEGAEYSYRSYNSSKITSDNVYTDSESKEDLANYFFAFYDLGLDYDTWCIRNGHLILKWETEV